MVSAAIHIEAIRSSAAAELDPQSCRTIYVSHEGPSHHIRLHVGQSFGRLIAIIDLHICDCLSVAHQGMRIFHSLLHCENEFTKQFSIHL